MEQLNETFFIIFLLIALLVLEYVNLHVDFFAFMYLSSVLLYMKNKEKFYAKIGHFLLQAFILD